MFDDSNNGAAGTTRDATDARIESKCQAGPLLHLQGPLGPPHYRNSAISYQGTTILHSCFMFHIFWIPRQSMINENE